MAQISSNWNGMYLLIIPGLFIVGILVLNWLYSSPTPPKIPITYPSQQQITYPTLIPIQTQPTQTTQTTQPQITYPTTQTTQPQITYPTTQTTPPDFPILYIPLVEKCVTFNL